MRRLLIVQIICCLVFSPFSASAIVSGSAVRASTGIISSISTNGAMYGGASGSKIVASTARSFAQGYFASASGAIPAGAAGGYAATEAVALSTGATGGLLRLGLQGAAAGARCLGYVGLVITAAQLAGMAWEWYQEQDGKGHFVQSSNGAWKPVDCGYLIGSGSSPFKDGWDPNKVFPIEYYSCLCAAQAAHSNLGNGGGVSYTYNGQPGTVAMCYAQNNDVHAWYPLSPMYPPANPDKKPVPWDEVQKKIEDDLRNRPNEWAQPFNDAVKEVPPAINPWLDETAKEDAAKPAPSPMPDSLPYPTPSGTPSVPNPSTGQPQPAPLPNELTKEDISKVASEILASLKPSQVTNIQTGDVTNPSANQDLANQISAAISAQIPQPPYDVKVINEPTIKIKTEDSWKGDAESAVGTQTDPDSNESLELNLDLEKYKSKKRDMSFLDTIYDKIKGLPLFQLFAKNPISISAGSSQFCLNVPRLGQHCIDLNDYSSVFETMGSVCIALTFFTCLAIIFL